MLIPRSNDLRENPAYVLGAQTDAQGRYDVWNVIPGDYFLFAVPSGDAPVHFVSDVADRNMSHAVPITVRASEKATADLKLFHPN